MQTKREEKTPDSSEMKRVRLQLYVVVAIFILVVILLLLPRGSALQQCLNVILQNQRQLCLYNLALSSGNASICSYTGYPFSNSCYIALAQKTNNASACQNVIRTNQSLGSICIMSLVNSTLNPAPCRTLGEPYASSCNMRVALGTYNMSLCNMVKNQTNRTVCMAAVNTNIALLTSNSSKCALVTNSINRSLVTSVYLKINQKLLKSNTNSTRSSLLGYLANLPSFNASARDLCYLFLAGSTQNTNYCSSIGYSQLSFACSSSYRNLNVSAANFTKLLAGCNNQSVNYRSICVQSVVTGYAISTKNATLCSSYFTPPSLWQCYSALAQAFKNSTYCGYIANTTINSACLLSINYTSSKH